MARGSGASLTSEGCVRLPLWYSPPSSSSARLAEVAMQGRPTHEVRLRAGLNRGRSQDHEQWEHGPKAYAL